MWFVCTLDNYKSITLTLFFLNLLCSLFKFDKSIMFYILLYTLYYRKSCFESIKPIFICSLHIYASFFQGCSINLKTIGEHLNSLSSVADPRSGAVNVNWGSCWLIGLNTNYILNRAETEWVCKIIAPLF
jgi:hypothetical protein